MPSFLARCPRDALSMGRRELNSVTFSDDGFPDLSINDAQRRLMRDEMLQWQWLQVVIRFTEETGHNNETKVRQMRIGMTDQEMYEYSVLHYFIVNAHADAASAFMTQTGIDGTPYVRQDDPLEQTRVRPIKIDKEELFQTSAMVIRQKLREACEQGNMARARRVVHQGVGREFWARHPELLFRLLLQQFVEIVKVGKYAKAVEFAQAQLAPFVEANPGYMVDVDRVYSVVAVDHQAPKQHADPEALWLLSKKRRYDVFRDINDVILRICGYPTTDMIQECHWMHSYYEESLRRLIHTAETQLAEEPHNSTRHSMLKSLKSWQSSLLSLEDIVQQRHDEWRVLMDRVEADGVAPDPEMQLLIERTWQKMVAVEQGVEVGESSVDEGGALVDVVL